MNAMVRLITFVGLVAYSSAIVDRAVAAVEDGTTLERQFRELPIESRRLLAPFFWLHGDESRERLEMYVGKAAEGGNGGIMVESRPHPDWLGPGWWRDLAICLDAAKKHHLKVWILDDKWFPCLVVGGKVPPRYAAKQLAASVVDVEGPKACEIEGYGGDRYIAAVAGRVAPDGKIAGNSLIDLSPFVRGGKLSWQVPAGRWRVMRFTHVQAPPAITGQLSLDGASKDCVDWFLQTVYQPHYDHFKADFGQTIVGFFYDEPETCGDWGAELNRVLAERKIDWKKAYVAYKFELSGEEQTAARFQYADAFAEAWGRTLFGAVADWCHNRGVQSIGHFEEHGNMYLMPQASAGDMMRLQKHSDMGGIDVICPPSSRRHLSHPNCPPKWQASRWPWGRSIGQLVWQCVRRFPTPSAGSADERFITI
jgi:hypothetical protein